MARWERRERKLRARREALHSSGLSIKKVLLPVIQRKAEAAERAAREKGRPPAGPASSS
jgi:hypothetical protein